MIIGQSIVQVPPELKSEKINIEKISEDSPFDNLNVRIYPNPNNGRFTIDLVHCKGNVNLNVYSMTGANMHQSQIKPNEKTEIDLPFLNNGIYFVRVNSGEEQVVKKIIVN